MNDRERLELAAKAAGIGYYKIVKLPHGNWVAVNEFGEVVFDPFANGGDALRLAVKLNLSIVIDSEIGVVQVGRFDFKEDIREVEPAKNLPYAATRRAIVRAAAEIGRNMK